VRLTKNLRLFKLARVRVRFDQICQLHRKRELQHHVTGCRKPIASDQAALVQ
jgi:hypothetical protein